MELNVFEDSNCSVSIFIPAYNAEKLLADTVKRIPSNVWSKIDKIWIINDGSSDGTLNLAQKLAQEYLEVEVIDFVENQGYGGVVKKGLELGLSSASDYLICLHGDGQYPPESLNEMLSKIIAEKSDIIQGSRIASGTALSGGMPVYKYIANIILTKIENIAFGLNLSDYHSGYLIYSRKFLDQVVFNQLSPSFDIDLELIASARANDLKVVETAIPTHYGEEESHLNPINYGFRCLFVVAKYLMGKYRR